MDLVVLSHGTWLGTSIFPRDKTCYLPHPWLPRSCLCSTCTHSANTTFHACLERKRKKITAKSLSRCTKPTRNTTTKNNRKSRCQLQTKMMRFSLYIKNSWNTKLVADWKQQDKLSSKLRGENYCLERNFVEYWMTALLEKIQEHTLVHVNLTRRLTYFPKTFRLLDTRLVTGRVLHTVKSRLLCLSCESVPQRRWRLAEDSWYRALTC